MDPQHARHLHLGEDDVVGQRLDRAVEDEWVVLTKGEEYRIYSTQASVVVEEKLFRSVKVTVGSPEVVHTLELLAKNRLEENRIEVLWRAHFVDRQVKAAIEALFSPESNDMLLVNYVAGATKNLTPDEIRSSIARCRSTFDFPVDLATLGQPAGKKAKRAPREAKSDGGAAAATSVTLEQVLAAGLLKAPATLTKTYKGTDLTATVLATGKVRFGGKDYDSLSTAASAARASVAGAEMATNGWDFWQVVLSERGKGPIGRLRRLMGGRGRATG